MRSRGIPKMYRGRIAPSPTGLLHLGHAATFRTAFERAREHRGILVLRNEDLDAQRCTLEFADAITEDLHWLGIHWDEGPDCGGPFTPYTQSKRRAFYLRAWERLRDGRFIYPCSCSRKEVAQSASAPNDLDDEPVYPGTCRLTANTSSTWPAPAGTNWRFRVQDGEEISFLDEHLGPQSFVAGRDFGDFIVWRRDDVPAYQLAVVVDDAAMRITEVVRGADLLKSTARQILLWRALKIPPPLPQFYHCDLVRDENGMRLAKRHDALSIRKLREMGWRAERVRTGTSLA